MIKARQWWNLDRRKKIDMSERERESGIGICRDTELDRDKKINSGKRWEIEIGEVIGWGQETIDRGKV